MTTKRNNLEEQKKELREVATLLKKMSKEQKRRWLDVGYGMQLVDNADKAGQEGKVKKILIRLLLRGRKRYLDIVWVQGKAYKVEIEEFIPAEKWVAKTKKALQNAEPNSKQVIFSIEEQQIPFFQ